MTRTDRVLAAIRAALEGQRPALDSGAPLDSISVYVEFARDGAGVRKARVRCEAVHLGAPDTPRAR